MKIVLTMTMSYSAGKVIIATGIPAINGQNMEIIDLINPKCLKTDLLTANVPQRFGSVGGHLPNQQPLICGGYDSGGLG